MEPVRRFVRNTKGTDFVVGDINGCFTTLDWLLEEMQFDETKDRLFVTGNLLGTGGENHRVLDYLDIPGFHPVLGANDYRFIDYWHCRVIDRRKINIQYPWTETLPQWQLENVIDKMATLPIASEIVTEHGVMGVIHGDCSVCDWDTFTRSLKEDDNDRERVGKRVTYHAVFGRERYVQKNNKPIDGIKHVYSGHSMVKHPTTYGNVTYMDTGVAMQGNLSAINLMTGERFAMPFVKQ